MKLSTCTIILVLVLFLGGFTGCTSMVKFSKEDNELRITEYGANIRGTNIIVGGQGVVGGVRIVQNGLINVCVMYKGVKVTVMSVNCPEQIEKPAWASLENNVVTY